MQVDTIHNGLDRCAALLKNILQSEATGCTYWKFKLWFWFFVRLFWFVLLTSLVFFQLILGRETIHKKPGKTASVKITSKPLLTKGNTSKKKGLKKNITPAHVRKEIGKRAFLGLLFSQPTLRCLNLLRYNKASGNFCYRLIQGWIHKRM